MPADVPGLIWWMLTGIIAVGFILISFLLSHWFNKIDTSLQLIWGEIKESRTTESALRTEIAIIRATCQERHGGGRE